MIQLSKADARRLLAQHHFRTGTIQEVFDRLGSVQCDPLKPVGRNHDLVLQARVPGYKVDDWQDLAYSKRTIYDGWDKQASLVRMEDWPMRNYHRQLFRERWEKRVLDEYPDAVAGVLDELERRGPLSTLDFEERERIAAWEGSWHGPKLVKNILRALWYTGQVLTHSRRNGHHVYDLASRLVPSELLAHPEQHNDDTLPWLLTQRHRAMGLIQPSPNWEVWSLGISATERNGYIRQLIDEGQLVEVDVEGLKMRAVPETLRQLDLPPIEARTLFVAPLDPIIWDRKAVGKIFGFDYLWEVYVPEPKRKWGYYVLPVFRGDRFVGRFDSRFKDGVWQIISWHWELGVDAAAEAAGLEPAVANFCRYLGATSVKLPRGLDAATKGAIQAGFVARAFQPVGSSAEAH